MNVTVLETSPFSPAEQAAAVERSITVSRALYGGEAIDCLALAIADELSSREDISPLFSACAKPTDAREYRIEGIEITQAGSSLIVKCYGSILKGRARVHAIEYGAVWRRHAGGVTLIDLEWNPRGQRERSHG
ncbi:MULTISPECIES: hypothetical protein [Alphaproteobacteria]|jgi:hypothetical protein|uniref:Uncharacterized protein n=1 Tax=Maricaulis virginensis TaxID=144022 RepID=A0A9W6MQ31_9PROT|nr:hypothetical protein [Maricaulis virginensis]GLK53531.1 hypothetical protein GCM10017621_30390 [Maricaulis virginensis]